MAEAQRSLHPGQDFGTFDSVYEDLRASLHGVVDDFAEDHAIGPGLMSLLLVDLGVTMHMLDYMVATEKPSSVGLRQQLDRFGREIDKFIRSGKQTVDTFIPSVKAVLEAMKAKESDGSAR
jgi:hypothetical protein